MRLMKLVLFRSKVQIGMYSILFDFYILTFSQLSSLHSQKIIQTLSGLDLSNQNFPRYKSMTFNLTDPKSKG